MIMESSLTGKNCRTTLNYQKNKNSSLKSSRRKQRRYENYFTRNYTFLLSILNGINFEAMEVTYSGFTIEELLLHQFGFLIFLRKHYSQKRNLLHHQNSNRVNETSLGLHINVHRKICSLAPFSIIPHYNTQRKGIILMFGDGDDVKYKK
mmetsp:Transcript_27690/g.31638  ORF Transcript_27690/g.31638 Transcript_27690/m.31638 type:complete len:150 (-) Transcript_27690:51-500(-)